MVQLNQLNQWTPSAVAFFGFCQLVSMLAACTTTLAGTRNSLWSVGGTFRLSYTTPNPGWIYFTDLKILVHSFRKIMHIGVTLDRRVTAKAGAERWKASTSKNSNQENCSRSGRDKTLTCTCWTCHTLHHAALMAPHGFYHRQNQLL